MEHLHIQKKLKTKGISTFIATLLMMVLAIAAGVMIYAYTMGYLGGAAVQPQIKSMQVQSLVLQGNEVWAYLKNTGKGTIVLDDPKTGVTLYINDKNWDYSATDPFDKTSIGEGETALLKIPIDPAYFNQDSTNKIKVITVDGTFVESSIKIYSTSAYTLNVSITPSGAGSVVLSKEAPYVLNDVVTITQTTNPGYTFSAWSGDGTGTTTRTVTITGHMSVIASYTSNQFTITASAGTGGTISPSGAVLVNNGASQAFTITASGGYHIADVLVDGSSVGAVASYNFPSVTAPHTIAASFAPNGAGSHTITASAGTGGTITPSGAVSVSNGADQSFTIAADAHYHIADVLVDGSSVGAVTTYPFTNVQADHTIAASFAQDVYTLTVTVTPLAGGSVSADIPAPYHYGDVVTLSQTTNAGYTFSGWSGDGGPSGADQIVVMTGNMAVTATYAQTTYSLTVTIDPVGAGTVVADIPAPYHLNDVVTLTQTNNPGYTFSAWSGDGVGTTTRVVTITSNMAVTATYVEVPVLNHFTFDTITGTKTAGTPFSITIRAIDQFGNPFTTYTGINTLSVSTGTIAPTTTLSFSAGVWTGDVTLSATGSGITIGTTGDTKTGTSNGITVNPAVIFGIQNSGGNTVQNGNSVTVSSLNCAPGDVVIVLASSQGGNSITSVTGGGLTWTLRTSISQGSHDRIWEYYAVTTSTLTSVTVNFGSTDVVEAIVFGISGANTANPFDGSARTAFSSSTTTPSVTGVSTTNANDMIIGLVGTRSTTDATAGSIAGTTGTLIRAQHASYNGNNAGTAAEYRVVSSTLSSQSVAFGAPSTNDWAMIVEAIRKVS